MVNDLARWAGRRLIYQAPHERTQCPACASTRLDVLGVHKLEKAIENRKSALISGCQACGLVFVNPPPSDEDLLARYAPAGEWARHRSEPVEPSPVDHKKAGSGSWPRLFDAVRAEFDVTSPPAGSRVLDFGCGRGKLLDVLQACGWETFGIEPASDAAFQRHHRLIAIPTTPTFDLIVAHHVLEHVAEPLALLKQLAAACQPGAFLLVAVPRLDTLPVHRDYTYVISRVHVTSYTATCLAGLLGRAGFSTVEAPRDEVMIAGGRRTTARLRMLAQRVPHEVPLPVRPLDPARAALRAYARQDTSRAHARRRFPRLSARMIESRRWFRRNIGVRLEHVQRRPNTP